MCFDVSEENNSMIVKCKGLYWNGEDWVKEKPNFHKKLPIVEHTVSYIGGFFRCGFCKRKFPLYYENKGSDYWGKSGRYNFRGAKANFNRHIKSCKVKQ